MRSAVLEARAAIGRLEQEMGSTTAALAAEREQLLAAERRGRLAEGIGDRETAELARRFAAKHSERVVLLERKLSVQRDELSLLERELSEMLEQLSRAEERARSAGAVDSGDQDEELLKYRRERAAREALAEVQLEALKRRMGR